MRGVRRLTSSEVAWELTSVARAIDARRLADAVALFS
jgi:hypothetical protein